MYTVYKYINIHNGKVYVGQTCTTLAERAQSNGHNYCECPRFYNAIKKYGWQSFVPYYVAENLTQDEANLIETAEISRLQSNNPQYGYNIANGGLNHEMNESSRKKISESAKERYKDPTKNPMYGRKHSAEALAKMREKKMGNNNPARKKLFKRLAEEGITYEEYTRNHRKRPVECLEDGLRFESITSAAKHYGVAVGTLCGCLNGYQTTCAGKHFKYSDYESVTTNCTSEIGTDGSGEIASAM